MDEEIPVIDFSTLAGGAAEERAQVIHHLETVSHDWGFFMVVSNGVPKRLMDEMLDACEGFFNLREDEKQVYNVKHVLVDPVRFGTSFNTSMEKIRYRRDYLKVFVRPRVPLPCTASRLQTNYLQRINLEVISFSNGHAHYVDYFQA
ncbi:hypothetical protein J5N97_003006 [Dioscorea zingiberensis]|uniref:Non-haem dioxygenase N-terminal domain-containing protein n=1 Tax=Dioscorea zingiberensis TaxID=325984 RepID=A0A9D5D392_9LILI|nr:hypothetical protein J5N97_003006 [Dioscorea zingiberensis]